MFWLRQIGQPVPPWKPGMLDIYQLNTGKGDCAFFILPDGTTMVFDAGEMNMSSPRTTGPRTAAVKPNDTKLPGEWLAFYMSKLLKQTPEQVINYAIISHFHDDHMGAPSDLSPMSSNGKYKLTGITAVGDQIPIKTMIDRGWPNYDYPEPGEQSHGQQLSGFYRSGKGNITACPFNNLKRENMIRSGWCIIRRNIRVF